MASHRMNKSPAVAQAETALRSLGVRASFNQRPVGRGRWFADWAGKLADSDVYVAFTGKSPDARKVRLLLDDWIFDDVIDDHAGKVLQGIFSAGATGVTEATLRTRRSLLLIPVQVLKVSVGMKRYTATRKLPSEDELAPWERALTAD
ncbi:hypothetical protein [Streptomyces sp. NBC_00370]|uniref:hypothetical protein n=1 Tax=Streptomyces sp. NBC_00370 TaxID=2975728 RepID=UPI002E27402C